MAYFQWQGKIDITFMHIERQYINCIQSLIAQLLKRSGAADGAGRRLNTGLKSDRPGFKSRHSHFLSVSPQVGYQLLCAFVLVSASISQCCGESFLR